MSGTRERAGSPSREDVLQALEKAENAPARDDRERQVVVERAQLCQPHMQYQYRIICE